MINRQQGIVVGVGALLGIACLGIGVLFFMALSTSSEAHEKRDLAYGQLKALYQSKVFPSDTNIQRLKDDTVVLEAWTAEGTNVLAKAALKVDDLTPVRFKQELQNKVYALGIKKAASGKPFVASDFKFGFDRYLGTDSLPQPGDVAQLAQQLKIIHLVVQELYAAKIMSLTEVQREEFEEDPSERKTGPSTTTSRRAAAPARRPGSQAGSGAKPVVTDEIDPALSTLLTRQQFTFGFQAKPAALIGVLNRLAAMDAFAVVSGVDFTKAEDSILLAEQRKKAAEKTAEAAFTAVAPSAQGSRDRIVTDPEREPQMNVKVSVDVYLFKGV